MKSVMKNIFFWVLTIYLIPEAYPRFTDRADNHLVNRKEKGYYNLMQTGFITGNGATFQPGVYYFDNHGKLDVFPSIIMLHGYMFDNRRAAGIGAGFEKFDRNLFPVFADVRYTLRDKEVSPFFAIKMGYAFGEFDKKFYGGFLLGHPPYYARDAYIKKSGGFMLSPEIGVKFPLNLKFDLLVTVAYRHQRLKTEIVEIAGQPVEFEKFEYLYRMHRLFLGLAIMLR